jgi:hypothetical protein
VADIILQNTLQQDLFLLAKMNYPVRFDNPVKTAGIICGYHILHRPLTAEETAFWFLKEFVENGILFQTPAQFAEFLSKLWEHEQYAEQPRTYHEVLVSRLMSTITQTKVTKDDGTFNFPFDRPQVDPVIVDLLTNA